MALNTKNPEVERLAEEVSLLNGESKTEAIRQTLLEQRGRLRERVTPAACRARIESFLRAEIWSRIPAGQLGHAPDPHGTRANPCYRPDGV